MERDMGEAAEIVRIALDGNARWEMVHGERLELPGEDGGGRRLCFLLGTLLQDFFIRKKAGSEVVPGPGMIRLGAGDIFCFDLLAGQLESAAPAEEEAAGAADESEAAGGPQQSLEYACRGGSGGRVRARLAVRILREGTAYYECMDMVQTYRDAGVREYWLIDMKRQFVYQFVFGPGRSTQYARRSFEQNLMCRSFSGFACSLAEVMWEDEKGLRELAIFHRFSQGRMRRDTVSEEGTDYMDGDDAARYSARAFYRWIKTRRNLPDYQEMTELLLGNICRVQSPCFQHQFIQGNLYFALRSRFRELEIWWKICFAPMAVELSGEGILDCVLRPDLFIVQDERWVRDNVYAGAPDWVIEIADLPTAERDYIEKEQIYQYHGVKEYWIINGWKEQVMVIRYPDGEDSPDADDDDLTSPQTRIFGFDEEIPSGCLPELKIRMKEVLEL